MPRYNPESPILKNSKMTTLVNILNLFLNNFTIKFVKYKKYQYMQSFIKIKFVFYKKNTKSNLKMNQR